MTTPLCFIDTETTGVHPDRRVWEVAIIRRDDAGERTLVLQVADVDLSNADPFGLKVGGFYDRHHQYAPPRRIVMGFDPAAGEHDGGVFASQVGRLTTLPDTGMSVEFDPPLRSEALVAAEVEQWTRGAHMVGVVPSFDADCLDKIPADTSGGTVVNDVLVYGLLGAIMLLPLVWLHGYRHGWEAMRTAAIESLRFSAALSRANGHATNERVLAKADAADDFADRLERPIWGMAPVARRRRTR